MNTSKMAINLYAKNGDSVQVPVGISRIDDKFVVNVPPKITVLELDKVEKRVVSIANEKLDKVEIKKEPTNTKKKKIEE